MFYMLHCNMCVVEALIESDTKSSESTNSFRCMTRVAGSKLRIVFYCLQVPSKWIWAPWRLETIFKTFWITNKQNVSKICKKDIFQKFAKKSKVFRLFPSKSDEFNLNTSQSRLGNYRFRIVWRGTPIRQNLNLWGALVAHL